MNILKLSIFFFLISFNSSQKKLEEFQKIITILRIISINYRLFCFYHHPHHVVPPARISLTLSLHFSLSFIASGKSSGLHPVSSQSCYMYVPARSYVGVHRSTSLMSSSLLLQQCPACLVRLTWIVFVMRGRWLYSWCLVGVLPPGLVQDCSQHSCVIAVQLLLQPFY